MKRLIISTAATIATIGLAAPANADQYDFISALDNQGVSYNNIVDMIELGKGICHTIRNGAPLAR
jgi:hypothetical protein